MGSLIGDSFSRDDTFLGTGETVPTACIRGLNLFIVFFLTVSYDFNSRLFPGPGDVTVASDSMCNVTLYLIPADQAAEV